MKTARFFSIDCGTQSLRAFVFDERGELLARSQTVFNPPYLSPKKGYAEQEADFYWRTLGQACQQIWQQGIDPKTITAATITTQRGTVVVVDDCGQPLHPAILWLDERQSENLPTLPIYWQKLHQFSGHQQTIKKLRKRAQANWFKTNNPDFWAKTHKFLLLSGYLWLKLTGEYTDAVASQVGYVPFDYKKHQWQGTLGLALASIGFNCRKITESDARRQIIRAIKR